MLMSAYFKSIQKFTWKTKYIYINVTSQMLKEKDKKRILSVAC